LQRREVPPGEQSRLALRGSCGVVTLDIDGRGQRCIVTAEEPSPQPAVELLVLDHLDSQAARCPSVASHGYERCARKKATLLRAGEKRSASGDLTGLPSRMDLASPYSDGGRCAPGRKQKG
jgi:hypothetical protein